MAHSNINGTKGALEKSRDIFKFISIEQTWGNCEMSKLSETIKVESLEEPNSTGSQCEYK